MEQEWPVITFVLITINLAVFLFSYNPSINATYEGVIEAFGLTPQFLYLKPYTLITHMFIHADIIHFGGNMLMLAIVGIAGERKVGSVKFFLLYLLSGLCVVPFAFLMEYLIKTSVILIGASGAIFGLMFLAAAVAGWEEVPAILVPVLNIVALPVVFFTLKNIKVPLFIAILFYLLLNLILMISNLPNSIGELAHFGGLFGGVLGFLFVVPEKVK